MSGAWGEEDDRDRDTWDSEWQGGGGVEWEQVGEGGGDEYGAA